MKNWIGVASAGHVALGRAGGFMQLCHGKAAPLGRLRPGDLIAYYSPVQEFGGRDKCQAFTAFGRVAPGEPYLFDMGGGFIPNRRDVDWFEAYPAPIAPLLECLEFTRGRRNWGYALRFGLLEISAADMRIIAAAMQTPWLDKSASRATMETAHP